MKIRGTLFCTLILLCFSANYSNAVLPDPGTRSTTTYTAINSDYGPRNFTGQTLSNSTPHVGIDYRITTGNKAYAVEGGDVTGIKVGASDAMIVIGNWRYIHMEDSSTIVQGYSADDKNPLYLEGIPADIIVFREIVDGSTITRKALSTQLFLDESGENKFIDPLTGNEVAVSTTVSQKEWIFVTRGGSSGNHLHLDYNNGTRNPLRYVAHRDEKDPIIWPRYKYIDGNNQARNFEGDIIYNTGTNPVILQAGVDIRGDKDLNITGIYVRAANSDTYTRINSWMYEPVTVQGAVNTVTGEEGTIYRKPTEGEIARAVEGGVYPLLDVVSFDFFKTRWDTLESESGGKAPVNSDAVWKDGYYWIKMEAIDITGHRSVKKEKKMLDNFRPYVKKVTVRKSQTQETYYKGEWLLNGEMLELAKETDTYLNYRATYTVEIEYSEGMSMAALGIGGEEIALNSVTDRIYTGTIYISPGIPSGRRVLSIYGKDHAGNETLKIDSGVSLIDSVGNLSRDSGGKMRGVGGEDMAHAVMIGEDFEPPEITWYDPGWGSGVIKGSNTLETAPLTECI